MLSALDQITAVTEAPPHFFPHSPLDLKTNFSMVQTTPAFRTLHRKKKKSRSSSVHAPSPKLSPFISAKQATALLNVFITLSRDRSSCVTGALRLTKLPSPLSFGSSHFSSASPSTTWLRWDSAGLTVSSEHSTSRLGSS